jgi:hypothetical protein
VLHVDDDRRRIALSLSSLDSTMSLAFQDGLAELEREG